MLHLNKSESDLPDSSVHLNTESKKDSPLRIVSASDESALASADGNDHSNVRSDGHLILSALNNEYNAVTDWLNSTQDSTLDSTEDVQLDHIVHCADVLEQKPGSYHLDLDSFICNTKSECSVNISVKCKLLEPPSSKANVRRENGSSFDGSVILVGDAPEIIEKENCSENDLVKTEVFSLPEKHTICLTNASKDEGKENPYENMLHNIEKHRPSEDSIIVLDEGYELARTPPGIKEFKAKLAKQAKKLSGVSNKDFIADTKEISDECQVWPRPAIPYASSLYGPKSAVKLQDLKEKLLSEVLVKKEAAFNKSKEIEKMDEENEALSDFEAVENDNASTDCESEVSENDINAASDGTASSDYHSQGDTTSLSKSVTRNGSRKMKERDENDNLSVSSGDKESHSSGSEILKDFFADEAELSGEDEAGDIDGREEKQAQGYQSFNDYSSSAVPSHQPGGGFPIYRKRDSIVNQPSESPSNKSNFCTEKNFSGNFNRLENGSQPDQRESEDSVTVEPDINFCTYNFQFDRGDASSDIQENEFESEGINKFCSGQFEETFEDAWSPGRNDIDKNGKEIYEATESPGRDGISENGVKDDDCLSEFSGGPESHKRIPNLTLKEFIDDEAELSGEDESGDEDDYDDEDFVENIDGGAIVDGGEVPSMEVLREEIAPLHLKYMEADDNEELNIIKEKFLDDGELHAETGGREKKYSYRRTQEENFANQSLHETDSEDELESHEFESGDKAKWRQEEAIEHETEMEHTGNEPSGWKSGLNLNIIGKQLISPGEGIGKAPTLKRKRGSFLSLNDSYGTSVLKRLKNSEDPSGSRTTKHYIFRNQSDNEVNSKAKVNLNVTSNIATAAKTPEIMSAFDDLVNSF